MRNFPSKHQLIYNHNSESTSFLVSDYPYGFRLRCKIRYWIESTKHGDRFCSQTTNPRANGEVWNKPKKSTYYKMIFMFINSENHVDWSAINYNGETGETNEEFKQIVDFFVNVYGLENLSKPAEVTLRMSYYFHLQISYSYRKSKYLPETLPAFEQWTKDTLKHVAHCEFAEIANHPAAPAQDNKEDKEYYTLSAPVSIMEM